ncbi:MAG: CHAT domain-containing protein [Planctomycetaceae bacterium]
MSFDELRREISIALRSDLPRARRLAARYARMAAREGSPVRRAEALVQRAKADHIGGRLDRAAVGYARARAIFVRARARRETATTDVSALQALALLGRAAEARRVVRRLRAARLDTELRGRAEAAIGNALAALGDERAAEEALRAALRDTRGRVERAHARLNLGIRLARRGAASEAIREFDRALPVLDAAGLGSVAEIARHNRGWARGILGGAAEAIEDLRAVQAAFLARGDRRRAALARLDEAELVLRLGDHREAARQALAAAAALRGAHTPLDTAGALLIAARAQAGAGLFAAARRTAARASGTFRAARAGAGVAMADAVAGRRLAAAETVLHGRGHLLAALGALVDRARTLAPRSGAALLRGRARLYPRALRRWVLPDLLLARARAGGRAAIPMLRRAVAAAEDLRLLAPTGSLRASSLAGSLGCYEALVRALVERGRAADRREAFRVLDAARARTLREEIEQGAPGATLPRRARTLRRRLDALWLALERRDREAAGQRTLASGTFEETARLEEELLRELEAGRGEHVATQPHEQVPMGACLAYASLGDEVFALLSRDGEVTTWSCGSLGKIRSELDAFRFQVARRLHGGGDAAAALAPLHRLAPRLLHGFPRDCRRLAVVLPPELGDLPLEALPLDGEPLLATADIHHSPAASLRRRGRAARRGVLLVGIEDEALPAMQRELRDVRRLLRRGLVLRGAAATREAILREMPRAGIVHIAGHARARDDRPPLSALRVQHGWLAAGDMARVSLRGALVVLSACRSGDPSLAWRGEAMGGFPRALLAAGASAVIASRWEISDGVAHAFMRRLYSVLPRAGATAAVARAARELSVAYPHPADWAGFLVIAGIAARGK